MALTRKRKLILGGAAALLVTLPWWGGALVRPFALSKAEEKLGHPVHAASCRLGWMEVVLSGIDIDGMGKIDRVVASSSEIEIEKAQLTIRREDVDRILGRGARKSEAAHTGGSGGGRHVVVRDSEITAIDRASGLRAHIGKFSCDLRGRSGIATLADIEATQSALKSAVRARKIDVKLDGGPLPEVIVAGGELAIWKGLALTGIEGSVLPRLALAGGYGGVPGTLWRADGTFDLESRRADVTVDAKKFTLDKLAPILDGSMGVLDPKKATVEGRLDVSAREGRVGFQGQLVVKNLDIGNLALAKNAVRNLTIKAHLAGLALPEERKLVLEDATLEHQGVRAILTGSFDASGPRPKLEARLQVPEVPCQRALAALPRPMVPAIADFKLKGDFAVDLSTKIDWNDLQSLELGGKVGIDGCKVVEPPPDMDIRRLEGSFSRRVELEPGHDLDYPIGPQNPEWTPFAEVSPHIINSLMTTEDNGFFKHHGFIGREFRSALIQNLERGYFRLGASSITMQMVKNVLLSREKTLARKLQELFLTWYVEQNLSKERIFEIYLNVIEFGPGIYGIGRAMHHYFGHPPSQATPREAAFFSSILPNPKRRYVHYCHGQLTEKWEAYLDRIVKKNHERGRLTDAEFAQGMQRPLVFDRKEAMPEKACLDMVKRLSAPPDTETDVADPFALEAAGGH